MSAVGSGLNSPLRLEPFRCNGEYQENRTGLKKKCKKVLARLLVLGVGSAVVIDCHRCGKVHTVTAEGRQCP